MSALGKGFRILAVALDESGALVAEAEDNRSRVMAYMYWAGEDYWRLTDEQWRSLYLLGDGFGEISEGWARDQAYDWSHVRDSSPAAIDRIWAAITSLESAGKLQAIKKPSEALQ